MNKTKSASSPNEAPVLSGALPSPHDLAGRIVVVRGQRVLLDVDLAQLYEMETKRFNEQIKRNQTRFPADFMFRLTDDAIFPLPLQSTVPSWRPAC